MATPVQLISGEDRHPIAQRQPKRSEPHAAGVVEHIVVLEGELGLTLGEAGEAL